MSLLGVHVKLGWEPFSEVNTDSIYISIHIFTDASCHLLIDEDLPEEVTTHAQVILGRSVVIVDYFQKPSTAKNNVKYYQQIKNHANPGDHDEESGGKEPENGHNQ
jgi:hypothetical protein